MRFIVRVVVNAFAIWVVTLIPALRVGVTPFAPGETLQLVLTLLAVAAIFALVNTIIGTVIKIVAIPLYILTLGLISFVINGLLLWITAWVTSSWGWGLTVESFWLGVVAAISSRSSTGCSAFCCARRRSAAADGRVTSSEPSSPSAVVDPPSGTALGGRRRPSR
jgi:putative membrane protein